MLLQTKAWRTTRSDATSKYPIRGGILRPWARKTAADDRAELKDMREQVRDWKRKMNPWKNSWTKWPSLVGPGEDDDEDAEDEDDLEGEECDDEE